MQLTTLKNENLDFHIKVSIPADKINNKVQKELDSIAKKAKLDGFRVGKAPRNIINKRYKNSIRADVLQHQISHSVEDIIKEHKLNIVGQPKLEDLKNEEAEDLEFTLKFELFPKIQMPSFKEISIVAPELVVKDEEIDKKIDELAQTRKTYNKESDKEVKEGDQVTIDAIGYVDGETFEGGAVTNHNLVIGSGAFIGGFEDQLIGSKKGEEVEVNVTFPENYHMKDIAGKAAKFIVQIKAVHLPEEPVIDDEFAKNFNYNTLDELRIFIKGMIKEKYAESINTIMKMSLFDQLESVLTFDVPQSLLVQEEKDLKIKAEQPNKEEMNDEDSMEIDTLFKGKSEEEVKEYYHRLALRRVRVGLLLAEYTKIKELKIEAADLQKRIMDQARNFPGEEKAIYDFYRNNPNAVEYLKGPLLEEKTVKHIFDNEVTIIEQKYNKEELEEFLRQQEEREIM